MAIVDANGNPLTKSTVQGYCTDVPATQTVINTDVYESFNYDPFRSNFKTFDGERRLKWKAGQTINKSEIDDAYPTATFASISPASGSASGGTPVTIKGTHLDGASGVTIGGNAITNFRVVNDTTITGTTAAHSAGETNVVIQDDAGNVTANNAYTFV
jgi:hypothetical protein